MFFTQDELDDALEQVSFATETDVGALENNKSIKCYAIQPFFLSSKVVVVRDGKANRTYVTFRGTELTALGSWFITDLQAASTEFYAVDPNLKHSPRADQEPELSVQGTTAKLVAPGRVHQGFLRTWSKLWYQTDILPTTFLKSSTSPEHLWRRYLFAGGVTALGLRFFFSVSFPLSGLLGLTVVLLIMAIESGSLERLLWKKIPPPKGPSISKHIGQIAENREIVFVGHSLGGALATLAFVAYRNESAAKDKEDKARLITFASPLVGDSDFVKDFEQRHAGRFLHVRNKGDLVTYAPPSSPMTVLKRGGFGLFWLEGILILLASVWWKSIYRCFWEKQSPYSDWKDTNIHEVGTGYRLVSVYWHKWRKYQKGMESFPRAS